MKMFKTIPVFILLITGYVCNPEGEETTYLSPPKEYDATSHSPDLPPRNDNASERSLPTLVVAGVSIALVLLCILIVAIFWYGWKKSQEGSIELNPIPYSEAGVSLRNLSVPENQQEWPFERAVQ